MAEKCRASIPSWQLRGVRVQCARDVHDVPDPEDYNSRESWHRVVGQEWSDRAHGAISHADAVAADPAPAMAADAERDRIAAYLAGIGEQTLATEIREGIHRAQG